MSATRSDHINPGNARQALQPKDELERSRDGPVEPIAIEAGETKDLMNEKSGILHGPADINDVLQHTICLEDDPSMPAITFRSMFLGVGLSVFGGAISGIYYFKPQTVTLPAVFLAVLAFLLGETMSLAIPRRGRIGRFLNPHPFNIKEHLVITIMSNSASISALGIEVIAAERLYYSREVNSALSIFLLLSSQFMGYGIVGMARRTLVFPKAMIWPSNIPINSMLDTLHNRGPNHRKSLRIFLIVFGCIFLWEIFPQWICPILTGVSIFCLANQKSTVFTTIFGGSNGNEGLGLLSLCFDWQYISGGTSPLYFPLSSLISQGVGICGCIVLFASVYYSNIWNAMNFPFLGQVILSDTSTAGNFTQWNQTYAIGPDNMINMTAVREIGLPGMSASNVLNMMLTNMTIAAAVVHLALWFPVEFRGILRGLAPGRLKQAFSNIPLTVRSMFRNNNTREEFEEHFDPHFHFMLAYKACPNWWYAVVLILSLIVGMVVIYESNSTMPWWLFFIAVLLGWTLIIVLGAMQAITGVNFTIQSMVQMIGGYIRPGDPVANMYFSLYGYNALIQGKLLAQDLKLAQYGHLAPRVAFSVQMLGTIIGAMLNYVLANSIITNQREILLSIEGTNIWSGNQVQQFNAQAVVWGGLPHELFSIGGKYQWVSLATLLGFVAPLPLFVLHRYFPHLGLDHVNTSVVLFYLVYLNVGINSSLMMFFAVGFASQWYIRRHHPTLFVRYNYLVSAALDGGTSVMVFILSFAVAGAAGAAVAFPTYWGNNAGGNLDRCAYAD